MNKFFLAQEFHAYLRCWLVFLFLLLVFFFFFFRVILGSGCL